MLSNFLITSCETKNEAFSPPFFGLAQLPGIMVESFSFRRARLYGMNQLIVSHVRRNQSMV
jgi:hypothetical protein